MWLQGFDERRSEDGEFQRGVELGHGEKNGARKTKIITAGYLFEISPLSLSHLKLAWSLVDPLHAQRVEALNLPAESPRRRSVEDKDDQHYCKLIQTEFEH